MVPNVNGKTLSIFTFDTETMKTKDKVVDIDFTKSIARNAGEVFKINGRLYRPAQDCTACYGHGVVLQRVEKKGDEWTFTNVNSLYPNTFRYNQGVHTFNHYKGLIVVDARGYRNPLIGRFLTLLMPCLKYFK